MGRYKIEMIIFRRCLNSSKYLALLVLSLFLACSKQRKIKNVSEDAKVTIDTTAENATKTDESQGDEQIGGLENISAQAAQELKELCEATADFSWDEDKSFCMANIGAFTSQETCEVVAGASWNSTTSQCFLIYQSITSQEECEKDGKNAWNEDSATCYPHYDLVTSQAECEGIDGLRWVASAKMGVGACVEDLGVVCRDDHEFDGESCVYQLGLATTSPAASCQAIKAFKADSADGVYWLKGESKTSFEAYCDMTSDGGGWTLVARASNADQVFILNSRIWYERIGRLGEPTKRNENSDAFSQAFWAVIGYNLKISRSDNPDDQHLMMTENKFLNNVSLRQFFTRDLGLFQGPGLSWAQSQTRFSVPSVFGNNFAETDGFQKYDCNGTIGQANAMNFLSAAGLDAAVIMIGGGGENCDRADHGIGITKSDSATWNVNDDGGCDFGFDAVNCSKDYSLNIFVR